MTYTLPGEIVVNAGQGGWRIVQGGVCLSCGVSVCDLATKFKSLAKLLWEFDSTRTDSM